ncbi:MAG TPA: flagellar biosynthetic protein FliO [Nitrosospira sp.]|jgi:flagellar protein FliO/FliZ|nr:flagellar biosynthetic protein FliO [Nitrosospira sp.]
MNTPGIYRFPALTASTVSRHFIAAFSSGCCSLSAHAAGQATQAPPSATDGGMLQVMLGLGLVLAVMAGCAWLLRRFGGMPRGGAGAIRVIGGSAVGQRERVVLIEVNDTWLVVGVAPGHVTALHSMPKGENPLASAPRSADAAANDYFPGWLKRVVEKRNGE